MPNFDEILSKLHDSAILTDTESDTPVVINSKRFFEIPENYNTVIAHEGDVNSQIITFRLPLYHENHKLSLCAYKRVKWKNSSSGIEGTSRLENLEIFEEAKEFDVKWEVPAEAFTAAGPLEISLSFYDLTGNQIAFSWNTPTFGGFSVGTAFTEIGEDIDPDLFIPAANEILFIQDETRQIIVPSGYNNVFCNYGDVGVSTVYFRAKKRIKGIDLTAATIEINVRFGNVITKYSNRRENSCIVVYPKTISTEQGLVDFVWNVPAEITFNSEEYVGNIEISIVILDSNKKWVSQSFNRLAIGESFIVAEESPIEPATDWIYDEIDKYMDSQEFVLGEGEDQ